MEREIERKRGKEDEREEIRREKRSNNGEIGKAKKAREIKIAVSMYWLITKWYKGIKHINKLKEKQTDERKQKKTRNIEEKVGG